MKRLLSVLLASAMILGLAACNKAENGAEPAPATANRTESSEKENTTGTVTEKQSETVDNSALSGKVVIYTSMYEDIIENIDSKLEEVFPNVDVEFFQGGTGTIQQKVAAEKDSGKLGADILMVAEPAYALELMADNYLHPYKFSETDKLIGEYDKDGYWYPVRILNMILAYNPEITNKEDIPNSFEDFAKDTAMKSSLSMSNPLTSGSAYASIVALHSKYGDDYFKELGAQQVMVESGSVALTKLETGECKEVMILEESVLKKREEEGSKLEVIYPADGTISVSSPIMIINDEHSANGNAAVAEAVEEWFLSVEGQEYIVKGWMHSVRTDYPSAPYDALATADIIKSAMPIDWQKCLNEREALRSLFQDNVQIPEKK
ncbi:ABC transporter substrate-binding protein [Lacrimispora sp.]|uniref:ABC transporter substrate-binding protein n=1 Tax=Lacrimispora sp. TaxID=2719234 RepID=UPI0028AD2084|nr:ABC transporter substrate-binding protein [Lacrimispora sp.]